MSWVAEIEILEDAVVGDFRQVVQQNGKLPHQQYFYILIGPHGAVQFAWMSTGNFGVEMPGVGKVMGVDVGYHAYERQHTDQLHAECPWLVGTDKCYYDGSGLRADGWLRAWEDHSFKPEIIWGWLMDYYLEVFSV